MKTPPPRKWYHPLLTRYFSPVPAPLCSPSSSAIQTQSENLFSCGAVNPVSCSKDVPHTPFTPHYIIPTLNNNYFFLSVPLFVFGPRYEVRKKATLVLINFIFGAAKLAIWRTSKNQMSGQVWTEVVQSLKGAVAACLRVEHMFYSPTSNLEQFKAQWGRRGVLCSLSEDGALVLNFVKLCVWMGWGVTEGCLLFVSI